MIASIFMLGGQVLAAIRVLTATAMLHGYSHALEAPSGDPGRYMLGFWAATALLQGRVWDSAGLCRSSPATSV